MPTYNIRGVSVDFPFEAYDCQIAYMEKVIQSLQEKCNALLESPTGTGKTLCLLCATLAWRKSLGSFSTGITLSSSQSQRETEDDSPSQSMTSKLPTIVYASRTHSQIRQVIQEMKRTSYRPKMVVLGSREQLCIHDEVSLLRGKAQTNACQMVRRRRRDRHCNHFPRVTEYLKRNPHIGEEPIDIEDMVNIGRNCGPCPYYLSRELHKAVDIVFAPYNYLIDRGFRKSLKLSWNNSVLIFDEAHNLESLCADAASFDLPSSLLTACISEAKSCINLAIERREKSNDKSRNPDDFAILRALLLKLENRIAEVHIESKELGFTKPGPYIYELLGDLNITSQTALKLVTIIEEAAILIEEDNQQMAKNNTCRLESISDILNLVFKDGGISHAQYYCVHIREIEARGFDGFKGKASRTLSWWCFNPGIAMEAFHSLGVGSIILTSGTLSPMESFAQELKLDFPIRLENPHVIDPNQIWAGVVPVGPSGRAFNSSYRTRESVEYKQELGNAIVNLARIVPDGLLVFFPSYYLLDKCIGCWKNKCNGSSMTIWERICQHKKPVIEPRESSLFASSIEDYMSKLKNTSVSVSGSGAIFFAVCRGKVSEGLDFADHAGRAVVITGMPFATSTDPKVRLKREYLDQQANTRSESHKVLTGEEWYNQQASRAVNQAVGRVIRHRYDYGAIIFCDERFAHPNRLSQISHWIQPYIKCHSRFGEVVYTLTRFFRDGVTRGPTKLALLQAKNNGISTELPIVQTSEKFSFEKLLAPLTTTKDQNCAVKTSCSLDTQKSGLPIQLEEIIPANRSSLSIFKNQISTSKGKPASNTVLSSGLDVINLADSSPPDEKPSKELLTSCSVRKRKFRCGEYDLRHIGNSSELSSGMELLLHKNEVDSQKNSEFIRQESKDIPTNAVASSDMEARGAAFLSQVRGKLSATEYKDFVGFMRALKTKEMKIGQVFQSIARLFSGTERLPLRKRFKDYIPAKYRSLYEQYVEKNNESVGC